MDLKQFKFANVLRVLAVPTDSPNTFNVFWRVGQQKQGRVSVTINVDIADKNAVAELCAMQHLIDDLEIIGEKPPLLGLLLEFSASSIKKVHAQKSEKKHLYPYAYFLTTRFASATVQVSKDASWILPRSENNVSELTITEPIGQLVMLSNFGKVAITRHVVDQYIQRMNNIEPHLAWKQLVRTLANAKIIALPNDELRREHDQMHHQTSGTRFYDRESRWCFVVADNPNGKKAIVTAYIRR